MHVIAQRRHRVYRIDDVFAKIPRMRSCEAHPANAGNFGHRSQELSEALLPCRIAIGIHILSKQLNFGIAELGHLPRLRQHGLRCPAALFAARERYYAVSAKLVAAFNNGDVSAMRIGTGCELGLETLVGFAVVESGDARALPCLELRFYLN